MSTAVLSPVVTLGSAKDFEGLIHVFISSRQVDVIP